MLTELGNERAARSTAASNVAVFEMGLEYQMLIQQDGARVSSLEYVAGADQLD